MLVDQLESECLNFDDNVKINENLVNIKNEQKYKYPKYLFDEIFPIEYNTKNVWDSVNPFLSNEFLSTKNNSILSLNLKEKYGSNDRKAIKNIKLELKKTDHLVIPQTSIHNPKLNISTEKIALEDWLDDVL